MPASGAKRTSAERQGTYGGGQPSRLYIGLAILNLSAGLDTLKYKDECDVDLLSALDFNKGTKPGAPRRKKSYACSLR